MFGEQISRSPRIPSPWSARLSTSVSTSASTTAPPTPPSNAPLGNQSLLLASSDDDKEHDSIDPQLPALHLLNMSCDDALSDISDEADGFFSLDMDVSIDQQLQDHDAYHASHHATFQTQQQPPAIPSLSQRFDPSPQRLSREASGSPLLNPAVRRASETVAYSSSPLQGVGLDPIMASRSRNSPVFNGTTTSNAASPAHLDAQHSSPPSAFGPIAPEIDQKGNLEYKLKILPPSRERFDRLVTQLKWRLLEGGGLAVYEIGVLDDGTLIGLDADSMKDSLKLLSLMAAEVGASCFVQRVLALEKVSSSSHPAQTNGSAAKDPSQSSALDSRSPPSRLTAAESDLSLRALAMTEARDTLRPYILAADLDADARARLLESGSSGFYRFDIAEQQTSIPPPLARTDSSATDASIASVAAVDPTQSASLLHHHDDADTEMAMSAQTKRRLLKATNSLPSSSNGNKSAGSARTKRDILEGRDQSEIVYLPSKEEKRILRAAAAGAELEAGEAAQQDMTENVLSPIETRERKMMAKMTRVADSVQPKTARARARARKSAGNAESDSSVTTPSCSASPSPTPSPAMKAANASSIPTSSTGAYTGYENVMSAFGVLSERAARMQYGLGVDGADGADGSNKARLIVEAVVRRDVDSEDNFVDFQGAKNKLQLDAEM